MKSVSIRLRIIFWFLALTIILIGTFGIVVYANAYQNAYELFETNLRNDSGILVDEIDNDIPGLKLDLEQLPHRISEIEDGAYQIYEFATDRQVAEQGYRGGMAFGMDLSRLDEIELEEEVGAYPEEVLTLFEAIRVDGKELYVSAGLYKIPVEFDREKWEEDNEEAVEAGAEFDPDTMRTIDGKAEGDAKYALIVVANELEPLESALALELRKIIVLTMLLLPLAMLLGFFLSRMIIRPIADIADLAKRISSTELSLSIPERGSNDELDQLITALNGAFDALRRAIESQKRFAADASHELRTPVSIIRSSCEIALRRERSAEDYRDALKVNFEATERVQELLEGLLFLAQVDNGKISRNDSEFVICDVIEETTSLLSKRADELAVEIVCECDSQTLVVADRRLLFTVFLNLVSNAIRYCEDSSKVRISVEQNSTHTEIHIADQGVGIDAATLPFIFDRFYRADESRARIKGGFGIGLSIVKEIVMHHEGEVFAESEVGVGTTFTIRLPQRKLDGDAHP